MHWSTCTEEYEYPPNATPEYGSILVPNVDNVRTDFLIQTIAKQGKVWLFHLKMSLEKANLNVTSISMLLLLFSNNNISIE